jgi:hypothetical protein
MLLAFVRGYFFRVLGESALTANVAQGSGFSCGELTSTLSALGQG